MEEAVLNVNYLRIFNPTSYRSTKKQILKIDIEITFYKAIMVAKCATKILKLNDFGKTPLRII